MTAIREVAFLNEDGTERILKVKSGCSRCGVTYEDIQGLGEIVVSPRGMAHFTRDYGETDCGKDATKPRWWWPL